MDNLQDNRYNQGYLKKITLFKGFMNQPKVGRNDPCPCGSGKKYKNCCMNKSEEPVKTYTSEGKRKFKAKVISLSEKSTEVFQKMPPAAALSSIPVGEGLKFKVTSKDYQVQPNEAKYQLPSSNPEPKTPSPESSSHQPGDTFELAQQDFKVLDENPE